MSMVSKAEEETVQERLRRHRNQEEAAATTDQYEDMSKQELALIQLPGGKHGGKTVGEVWEAEPKYVDWLAARHYLEPGAKYEALGYYVTLMTGKGPKTKTNTKKGKPAKEQKSEKQKSEDVEISDEDSWDEATTLVQQAASSLEAAPVQVAAMHEMANRMNQMENMVTQIVTAINHGAGGARAP